MTEKTASHYWNEETSILKLRRKDILLFEIYATTLLLGSIYSIYVDKWSITSYFGNSKNLINLIFVKRGWFWTSLVYFYHAWDQKRNKIDFKFISRYIVATLWWMFVTQWFIGPGLIDRTFALSGGSCKNFDGDSSVFIPLTASTCKGLNGSWSGGHDLSGHVFLLTHSSLFMLSENFSFILNNGIKATSTKVLFGLLGLWWWMLFVTASFYHTTFEKCTGFFSGILEWSIVYVFSSRMPAVADLLGSSDY
ncbi:FIT family protein scs3 [Schizosaccharomyces pombe]|uniref:Acyl-coenzyme A diphosphatase fit1 n=1 Tax=Schizosaccharomyces pombe (strain 972 / ATCC 24843) TaxID=284812 RepID=SCS3_SCHPO|nr:putative phosphoinositide biosynthesis protein [Schizosaccharomyces pombe]Q9HGM4.1 RecName: Full=Acyl-coenzyme A diphosphatase fit1; AltName: Full=Acyl-coenzyme A diphosphatase scs3; AltName: Full=FIT family protein scs3 [Schizosaccharomyces pombe 972h-]CAC05250.1 phosphoinositide biosynthesis protein (predicted) [Schizosaccharomyces pombe]|eukprot:NP_596796.1 putative phosphoinositide biosynthesis protein [Schizosaccharomyces pombe]